LSKNTKPFIIDVAFIEVLDGAIKKAKQCGKIENYRQNG
jgi:hypothetical protein